MTNEPSDRSETTYIRKAVLIGSCIGAVILIGFWIWLAVPDLFNTTDYLGRPPTGATKDAPKTAVGTGMPSQREAESSVAKQDPAGNEDPTGGRARKIKQSSKPAEVTPEQREKLRGIFASQQGPRDDHPKFDLMIGTAVPSQTKLADIPPEATEVLNGYWGDQYLIVGDSVVIVDLHSRRVAAILSGLA
jgi:hypothetical protein